MTDAELRRKIEKLEALTHSSAHGGFFGLRDAMANLPLIVELSLELTKEIVRRVLNLETLV